MRVYHRRPCSGLLALLLALRRCCVAACGEDDDAGDEAAATAEPRPRRPRRPAARRPRSPRPKGEGKLTKPKEQLDPAKTYVATVSTNCGDFEITLDAKRAPKTGGSFKSLADKGFYDGTDVPPHRRPAS